MLVHLLYILFYSPMHMLKVSQITQNDYDDDPRTQILNAKCNNCIDKRYVKKKDPKKKVSQHLPY